jgi:hypothetical protein
VVPVPWTLVRELLAAELGAPVLGEFRRDEVLLQGDLAHVSSC